MQGFINMLKPPGMTSHDMVGYVRRVLQEKRVGHAGTLDPGAAGVLPIAVGKAARFIEYLSAAGKSYRAEVIFGRSTDSGDDTGKTVASVNDFSMPGRGKIQAVLEKFIGSITQVPPAHSAIKINGQRACDLLRQGKEVDIPSREITIYRLELLDIFDNGFRIDVDCSKGTYIRTLCTDIGEAMGIPATMGFLLRTRAGDFKLADTVSLEELAELQERALLRPDNYLSHLPRYDLIPNRIKALFNGLSTNDWHFREKFPELIGTGEKNIILRIYGENKFLGIGHFNVADQSIIPDKLIVRD